MPKEQLGNRGSIQHSLQGEIRQDGHSTLVCPACGWELPAVLCGDPNVPQPGPSCPTPHSQSGSNLQRWDTAAPAPLSRPTVRARCKSTPSSRQARVLQWSCWSQGCFLKAQWVKNPYGVLGGGDVCSWSSTGPSYEELRPTKVTVPGDQVQSEGLGNAWTQGRVWQHQRRKEGRMSHTALLGPLGAGGSHSTLSWRHLGCAVPPVPRDAGGTLHPAPRALAGPVATCNAIWLRDLRSFRRSIGALQGSQYTLLMGSQPTDLILTPTRPLLRVKLLAKAAHLFIEKAWFDSLRV